MGKQVVSCQMVLVVNPGSTSTKIAVFMDKRQIFLKTIRHSAADLQAFEKITDQFIFRKKIILDEVRNAHIPFRSISAVIGRGGMLSPLPSGVYEVTPSMIHDLSECKYGEHASNLGGLIAGDLIKDLPNARAFIADPVVVDELDDVARVSGHPLFQRKSILHTLNQKAVARHHASAQGKKYEEMKLIVAHLGGGITVGAHALGRIIDVNQGLDGEGPFSPERSGTLPAGDLVRLCFSGMYSEEEILKMICGRGGYMAYFGSNNALEIQEKALSGDKMAELIQDALCYQVAKEIGAMSAVLCGELDAILITGGLAFNETIVSKIKYRIKHLAQVFVYPGEDEMQALAYNAFAVLSGEIVAKKYADNN